MRTVARNVYPLLEVLSPQVPAVRNNPRGSSTHVHVEEPNPSTSFRRPGPQASRPPQVVPELSITAAMQFVRMYGIVLTW
jgi:hypothetical protein